jgi:N-acetylglucosaminyl-diphospho-decaprenol L-rhamnosyltransferase
VASPGQTTIDAVVVTHNNREQIRSCIQSMRSSDEVEVTVVDNASFDGTVEAIADLGVRVIGRDTNDGFAIGCNAGWRSGVAPFVLFVNPDVTIARDAIDALVAVLEESPAIGAVGPRIVGSNGELEYSQRRFPRLRSTFAQALMLHRVLPKAGWTDDVVRDPALYEHPGPPDWISGACLMTRREVLVTVGGFDERFFMYREDVDLCRRVRACGYEIRFEPSATCVHAGGASAPRASLLPVLAESRIRYARKHSGRLIALFERVGVAAGAAVRVVVGRGGIAARAGHARSFRVALFRPIRR